MVLLDRTFLVNTNLTYCFQIKTLILDHSTFNYMTLYYSSFDLQASYQLRW